MTFGLMASRVHLRCKEKGGQEFNSSFKVTIETILIILTCVDHWTEKYPRFGM